MYRELLVISDIEGSSECRNYAASSFLTEEWPRACLGMTRDVAAVTGALSAVGARSLTVKDFHRTGYNIFPEMVPEPARIVSGYRPGPVPGIGDPGAARAVLFIGMHASSGSGGFLAHTLTSRIARLEVNGRLMSEVELFSASLAPFGIRPLFFSGCPTACREASEAIPGIETFAIDKEKDSRSFNPIEWRQGLAAAAAQSLENRETVPFFPDGPFEARVTMRDGETAARKLSGRWNYTVTGSVITIVDDDIHGLYAALLRLCYLTPLLEKMSSAALGLYGIIGRYGLARARRQVRKEGLLA